MEIQKYLDKIKSIYHSFLEFLCKEMNNEEHFQNLIQILEDHNIFDDHHELKVFLRLLLKISNNHFRTPEFFGKIERIILLFREQIKQSFSNNEIFNIFKNNKRILLLLIENEIIFIDESISNIMNSKKYKEAKYLQYFINELKPFLDSKTINTISKNIQDDFEEKRKNGENENYLCQLIRHDSIEEFTQYVNQNNLDLKTTIEPSLFETNSYLYKNKVTLIQYSFFFGAMKIINYLKRNGISITPSLWLYGIHNNNKDLIHFLVENHIDPADKIYHECYFEAIKCHHNEIAEYIKEKLLKKESENNFKEKATECYFRYFSFPYIPVDFNNKIIILYLCEYDYFPLVKLLLKFTKMNLNDTIV